MDTKWDRRFLSLAELVSQWSKDPSSQVGAVAIRDRRILATGYNGFPAGMADDDRLAERISKYPRIVHAEGNIIAWAAREGVSLMGAHLYVFPYHPCPECARMIVQAGFTRVVVPNLPHPERWDEAFNLAGEIFRECGVTLAKV